MAQSHPFGGRSRTRSPADLSFHVEHRRAVNPRAAPEHEPTRLHPSSPSFALAQAPGSSRATTWVSVVAGRAPQPFHVEPSLKPAMQRSRTHALGGLNAIRSDSRRPAPWTTRNLSRALASTRHARAFSDSGEQLRRSPAFVAQTLHVRRQSLVTPPPADRAGA
jgi:hypothetical protein